MLIKRRCGFFWPEGDPWNDQQADLFAALAIVEGMPLCFRLHDIERDLPEAAKAAAWGKRHGMHLHASIGEALAHATPAFVGQSILVGVLVSDGWGVSVGNGKDWRDASYLGSETQDDSGPVGAMYLMQAVGGRVQLFHAYGQSGFDPVKMLPILAAAAEKTRTRLVWSECNWGFPGEGKTIGDRPDVVSAGAGAWLAQAHDAAEAYSIPIAIYTPRYLFTEDGALNAAGQAFFGYGPITKALRPPRLKSWLMRLKMLTV